MVVVFDKRPRGPGLLGPVTRDVSAVVHPDSRYTLTILLDAAELQDSTYTIPDFLLEGTTDPTGATGWHILCESNWTGGISAVDKFTGQTVFPPPSMSFATDAEMPVFVRVSMNTPRRTNIGLDVTVAPA